MIASTVCSIVFASVFWCFVYPARSAALARAAVVRLGGTVDPHLLGYRDDEDASAVAPPSGCVIDLSDCDDADGVVKAILRFDHLSVLAVGGDGFTDLHLSKLEPVQLDLLVLDSTLVTDQAILEFRRTHRSSLVRTSQRRLHSKCEWVRSEPGVCFGQLHYQDFRGKCAYLGHSEAYGQPLAWNLLKDNGSHFSDARIICITKPYNLWVLKRITTADTVVLSMPIDTAVASAVRDAANIKRVVCRQDSGSATTSGAQWFEEKEVLFDCDG